MAFDAGFTAATVSEIDRIASGARIEKIYQPTKDTVIITLHCQMSRGGDSVNLLIDAGTNNPRVCFTSAVPDNPKVPPNFCMLLRKHLGGAKLISASQPGFERAIELRFEAHDELEFISDKYLIAEIMGKCSNLMLLDAEKKIVSAMRIVDFSTSRVRQVLPGMKYELPPPQEGKISPFDETEDGYREKREVTDLPDDKFILQNYLGISPLIARELAYRGGDFAVFDAFRKDIAEGRFVPVLIKKDDGSPVEYSFTEIRQYGDAVTVEEKDSFGALCDAYFGERSRSERIRQRAADILHLLTNAESRLTKKIAAQEADLAECAKKEQYKTKGDLITANIYRLKRGMTSAELIDYSSPDMETVHLALDQRLTPAQNAQVYYKKYNKAKSAETALTGQLEIARRELEYIYTVFDSLTRADTEADLAEIRRELYESGYASRMKNITLQKPTAPKPLEFKTSGGYRILCGKNNSQNDYITHKLASKGDLWFHVKGMPGSHVVLFCDGDEPSERDFTEAATIAATYSKADAGNKVAVDYTRVKNLKKPPASKPGFVTFSQNYSAYVTPDPALCASLASGKKK